MNTYFPRMITLLRKEKKLSQKQAAKELEISQALLSHYEKGIRECGLEFLVKIADYYGVSCDYLLGKTNTREVPAQKEKTPQRRERYTPEETKILRGVLSTMRFGERFQSEDLSAELALYFKRCVYKAFRGLYGAGSENPKELFSLDEKTYRAELTAAEILAENTIELLARGENPNGKQGAKSVPALSRELMHQSRPEYADAIEAIIEDTEA